MNVRLPRGAALLARSGKLALRAVVSTSEDGLVAQSARNLTLKLPRA